MNNLLKKEIVKNWFKSLQGSICAEIEKIEDSGDLFSLKLRMVICHPTTPIGTFCIVNSCFASIFFYNCFFNTY